MMPVPSHLSGCVVPVESAVDETPLEAVVRCKCGSHAFHLLYCGEAVSGHNGIMPTVILGHSFFVIKARCCSCKSEYLLLDKDLHGWNGFVARHDAHVRLTRPEIHQWTCQGCGSPQHSTTVYLGGEGQADFIDNAGPAFSSSQWPDGFGWFSLDIRCIECGVAITEWVSYETM